MHALMPAMKRTMRHLMAIAALACAPAPALAQVAAPPALCLVLVDPLDFGNYSPLSPAPMLGTSRVELRCLGAAVSADARVALSTGSSGRYEERSLLHGADVLRYNLYADPARRQIAGDGSQGTVLLTPTPAGARLKDFRRGLAAATRAVFRIYAKLDPRQPIPAGEYADTVLVIVEF